MVRSPQLLRLSLTLAAFSLLVLLIGLTPPPALADGPIYVDKTTTGDNDGSD
jgi:hypothetical protein